MINNYSNNIHYTLHFDSIQNSNGAVRLINHSSGEESTIKLIVDDKEFRFRVQLEFPSIIADLIDLAVAIHASDRLVCQNPRQNRSHIYVILPVRYPELLNASSLKSKLEYLLEYATGSCWNFDFQERVDSGRVIEIERVLFPCAPKADEVVLWSGGLDALAGLYTGLRSHPEKSFVLFGTGSNEIVYARQGEVAQQIQFSFPGRSSLYRVPIRFQNSDAQPKNRIPRARGVVFTLLGSACAYLMGQHELCVYENGVGAINLPYRSSAVGLDHSRSVHPLTLLMVSEFVSELLGEAFLIKNPFLFWTKAEMCRALAEDGRTDLPPLTKSCDSPHRQQPVQCGYCSSCLLRRQALAASRIEDKTKYVILHGNRPVEDPSVYLRHMLAQINTLQSLFSTSNCSDRQWEALTQKFLVLDDIVDRTFIAEGLEITEMRSHLLRLYQNYVTEWRNVEPHLSVGLLSNSDQQPLNTSCSAA